MQTPVLDADTNDIHFMGLEQLAPHLYRGQKCVCSHARTGVTGLGNPESGIVIVGIAPGYQEIKSGVPFFGQSGQLLNALLKYCGLEREQVYCTNLLCWFNNKPTAEDIAGCKPRFDAEMAALHPKVVLLMGTIPTQAVLGRKVGAISSQGIWHEPWGCYVIPTYHPAGVLRGTYGNVSDIIWAFRRVYDIMGWKPRYEQGAVNWAVVNSKFEAQHVLDNLPVNNTVVSLDIETTSHEVEEHDIWADDLLCLSIYIAERDFTFTFPSQYCKDLNWPTEGVRWTFHGGAYDVPGLIEYLGVRLPIVEDTMLQSYTVDERPGHHKLKSRARELEGAGFWEDGINRSRLQDYPPAVVHAYNAKDAAYTGRMVPKFEAMMQQEGTEALYRELLIPAANVFVDTQLRGVRIDQAKLRELGLEWIPRYLAGEQELIDMAREYGWKGELNVRSAAQKSDFLYKTLGLKPPKTDPGKRPTTARMQIEQYADHPWVSKWLAQGRLAKVVDSYMVGVQDDVKRDGRIHPRVLIHNTATGRRAYHDPPIQTLPQEYTVGAELARIREIFAPSDDEHEILEADYNQIEVWTAAALTEDAQLWADLMTGDVHGQTASGVFHIDKATADPALWQRRRQNAKKIRFGLMYGEGPAKLALPEPIGIGGTRAEAAAYLHEFWTRYPQHYEWVQRMSAEVRRTGRMFTPTGRQRRFHLVLDQEQIRQAINFPIQSIASDYALTSIIELHPLLARLDTYILFEVHDSIVFDLSIRHKEEALALIKSVMEKPRIPGFPSVKIDMKVGPNLGQVSKIAMAA